MSFKVINMNEEKIIVTEEGKKELENELENLISHVRQEVIEDLRAARAQGDLSENADYDAARDRQARVEARIKELENMLQNIEVISESHSSKYVRVGSQVKILDMETNMEAEYNIVGSVEADPLNGKLSNVTPLAMAILDKSVGSVCTVDVDNPYKVKILEVK